MTLEALLIKLISNHYSDDKNMTMTKLIQNKTINFLTWVNCRCHDCKMSLALSIFQSVFLLCTLVVSRWYSYNSCSPISCITDWIASALQTTKNVYYVMVNSVFVFWKILLRSHSYHGSKVPNLTLSWNRIDCLTARWKCYYIKKDIVLLIKQHLYIF